LEAAMGAWESAERRGGRVFYPYNRGVLVNDKIFVAGGRHYPLTDLSNLGWRPGSAQGARKTARDVMLIEGALVAVVMAVGMVLFGLSWGLAIAAGLYLAGTSTVYWIGVRRWPTPLLLVGDYRGVPTVLYSSTDADEFHKVCRAVLRAVEFNEELAADRW
jgi:hypothetical protein